VAAGKTGRAGYAAWNDQGLGPLIISENAMDGESFA
jgi:hypothetical protein